MELNKNDIDTYLYQLTERVKRLEECVLNLEKCMLIEDKFDKGVQEQLEITKDCLKKQHEWNKVVSENFASIKKYIDLVTGGNKE